MVHDIEMIHNTLQQVTRALNLPPPGRLQSAKQRLQTPTSEEPSDVPHLDEVLPSCDVSPKVSPEDDNDLPRVPIQSLYHLTKLSALRSPDTETEAVPKQQGAAIEDFISRGILSLEDAERLFRLYMDHLDHFMYGIGGRHETLEALRRSSRILAVSILTVAALHDQQSNSLYGICSKEFRRLLAASVFNRRIDRDYLRAMVSAYSRIPGKPARIHGTKLRYSVSHRTGSRKSTGLFLATQSGEPPKSTLPATTTERSMTATRSQQTTSACGTSCTSATSTCRPCIAARQ